MPSTPYGLGIAAATRDRDLLFANASLSFAAAAMKFAVLRETAAFATKMVANREQISRESRTAHRPRFALQIGECFDATLAETKSGGTFLLQRGQ